MSGKLKDTTYKVFISPDNTKYYSLKKAMESGFSNDEPTNTKGSVPKKKPKAKAAGKCKTKK